MEVKVNKDKKIVEVWLSKAEKSNFDKSLFADFQKEKYFIVIFESGEEDLYSNTLSLLSYNKKRLAELTLQSE